jgi:hypothetical protein
MFLEVCARFYIIFIWFSCCVPNALETGFLCSVFVLSLHCIFKYGKCAERMVTIKAGIQIRKERMVFLVCICLSAIFLLFCTKSSFLYPLNDWNDSNCFFTVGKGILEGRVPYRDLFEQKGPLLYILHGLASLVSSSSFVGVFILEILSFSVFLWYSYRLIRLYQPSGYAYIILPLLTFAVLSSNSFYKGDSAEEFCMPLLSASFFYLLRYFKNRDRTPISYPLLLLNGMLAGCVLWIKYTMLGFWFAWMMMVFFDIVRQKRMGRAFLSCAVFLAGMLLTGIPWVVYFAANGAMWDFINAYFIVNIFGYSQSMGMPSRLLFMLVMLCMEFVKNVLFALPAVAGVIFFTFSKRWLSDRMAKLTVAACFLFLIAGVYGGGSSYPYYFLIFAPFAPLGYMPVLGFLEKKRREKRKEPLKYSRLFLGAYLSALLVCCFFLNQNTKSLGVRKAELVQYQFAEIIRQTPGATLLNYGFLDGGFYLASGITPQTKYFCKLNITVDRYPEMMQEQNRYLKEKLVDYVVVEWADDKDRSKFRLDYLRDNYIVVAEQEGTFDREGRKYILYRAKEE